MYWGATEDIKRNPIRDYQLTNLMKIRTRQCRPNKRNRKIKKQTRRIPPTKAIST